MVKNENWETRNIKSTQENTEWEGVLVEVDAIGFTINYVKSGRGFHISVSPRT